MTSECVLTCIAGPAAVSFPFWLLGWVLGSRVGNVARHAIAWFFVSLVMGIFLTTMAYLEVPSRFAVDFRDGRAVEFIIHAVVVASAAHLLFWCTVRIFSMRTRSANRDERSIPEFDSQRDGNPYSPPRSMVD